MMVQAYRPEELRAPLDGIFCHPLLRTVIVTTAVAETSSSCAFRPFPPCGASIALSGPPHITSFHKFHIHLKRLPPCLIFYMAYSGLMKAELSVLYERDAEASAGESFVTMTPTQATVCYAKDWLSIFRQYDIDNDGFIPFHEMSRYIDEVGHQFDLTRDQKMELLAGVDRNADKYIDFSEFCFMLCRAKKMHLKRLLFHAARTVIPKSQREEHFTYLSQYSCIPPPIFILLITAVEVSVSSRFSDG
ncbi:unnamed protein product [Soboliphyme baturini]|uniref:EF-hand domain-containing protein n=1 Tax=Soboliphyme baturini TaxID=241478 RepID=A0A183IJA8_9BILA|nr:unnamed protein product [Soboliphyme baturini]